MKISEIKQKTLPILKKYKINKAGIFGSAARGEMKKSSDIDILINIHKNVSLLGLSALKIELEKALKKKVDLVEYDKIKPSIKQRVLKEEVKVI